MSSQKIELQMYVFFIQSFSYTALAILFLSILCCPVTSAKEVIIFTNFCVSVNLSARLHKNNELICKQTSEESIKFLGQMSIIYHRFDVKSLKSVFSCLIVALLEVYTLRVPF